MKGHGSKIGRKQEEAVAALLVHSSIEQAAKSVGIAPKTLMRWIQTPEFDRAYRKARRDVFGQALARLQQGSGAAASTLLKVMVDPSTSPSLRVRAAEAILARSLNAIQIEDVEVRLSELERAANLYNNAE